MIMFQIIKTMSAATIYLACIELASFCHLPMVNVTCHFLLSFSFPAGNLKTFFSFPWRISNVMGPSSSGSNTVSRGMGFTLRPACFSYRVTTSWSSCTVKACLILELMLSEDISTTTVSSGWTLGPSFSLMAASRAAGTLLGKGFDKDGKLLDVWMLLSLFARVEFFLGLSSRRSQLLDRLTGILDTGVFWIISGKRGMWLLSVRFSVKSVRKFAQNIF